MYDVQLGLQFGEVVFGTDISIAMTDCTNGLGRYL